MTQKFARALPFLAAILCMGLLGGEVRAQDSVSITDESTAGFEPATIRVRLTNSVGVQGFVLAIGYDTTLCSVTGAGVDGTVSESVGAELVVSEIFDALGGFTLGVVLDSEPPFSGQVIGPGSNLVIANFEVTPDVIVPEGDPSIVIPFEFVDGTFNSPILDNILVEGGESISILEETDFDHGSLTLTEVPLDSMDIQDFVIPGTGSQEGTARVVLSNFSGPVQGFVTAIVHDPALQLEEINLDDTVTDDVGAEFTVFDTSDAAGGTAAVVLDFDPPFDGQTIPTGSNNRIVNYVYSCVEPPIDAPEDHGVDFADGTLGSPLLDNVIVVAGLSLNPGLSGGTATCMPPPVNDAVFYLGADDGAGGITNPHGFPGETVSVCWWYSDPTDNIQGFQGAMCIPAGDSDVISFQSEGDDEDLFDISDTIIDAIGTEFVSRSVNGAGDEQTIGILLDALPPFEDQTAPQTSQALKLGCFGVVIGDNASCDECYAIEFCNGIEAGESVALDNLIVIDFFSANVGEFLNTEICIDSLPEFLRGDCNSDSNANLADAAAILGYQFHDFAAGCLDACDSNDDGKINLADTVYVLSYLFKSGDEPPAPFPNLGTDESNDDDLDCENGTDACS